MSKNLLSSTKEIEDALRTISSLDYSQRDKLVKRFQKELDFGGISEEEYDNIIRDLYENKMDYDLSDTDYNALKKLKEKLKS